jgi:hypothetical protein
MMQRFIKLVLVLSFLPVSVPFWETQEAEARFFFRRSRSCGLFSRCRPVFNRRFNLVNRGGNRVVRGQGIDFRNQKRIPGFSRIRTAGNAIVGVDKVGRAFGIFVDGRGILRDGFGRNLSVGDKDLVKDLREFYVQNLDNFRGRARNTVLRFLARHSSNIGVFGQLAAAVRDVPGQSMGVVPSGDGYKGFSKERIRTAALSFLMNTLSNSCTPLNFSEAEAGADGAIRRDMSGFIDNVRLSTLLNENPYSCGDARAPARVDWLVARGVTPEIYYPVAGLSDNLKTFSAQVGVKSDQQELTDFNGQKIDRILVKGFRDDKESIVGVNPQRVLEVQSRANGRGSYYRSYDFLEHPTPGQSTLNRDVLSRGIGFASDASEIIFTKCNNFLGFYLADGNGNRARAAPGEIAIDGGRSVVAPDRCLKCHANGFLGGGRQAFGKGEDYTDHFNDIAELGTFHSQFFSRKPAYDARRIADSNNFNAAKRLAGAHLEDPQNPPNSLPILFDMAEEYRKPLTLQQAAAELGTSATPQLESMLELKPNGTIDREDFQRKFCLLRSSLGLSSSQSLDSFQQTLDPNGLNHRSGGTGQIIRRPF